MTALQQGDFFTVYDWPDTDDHSWIGHILQVLEVQRPFVVVQEVTPWTQYALPPFTLNLHEVRILPLTDAFVVAQLNT